ncbi:MAG: hypothetical protein ABSF32_10485 [Ignavibacteria bacterium]
MDRSQFRRSILISLLVIFLSITNYTRLSGTENIRTIHIVTLLVCGMGIGVLLVNTIHYFKSKQKKK